MKRFLNISKFNRFLFFFLSDIVIITASLYLSFYLRFDFALTDAYYSLFLRALPLFIIIKLGAFALFRMYKITWRYVGLNDLYNIIGALIASESLLMVLILIPLPSFLISNLPNFLIIGDSSPVFPRSIFLIDWIISVILLSGLRISKRVFLEIIIKKKFRHQGKNTIIIGAGNTGEMILRDMSRQDFSLFYPVGMLDDDIKKSGSYVHGIEVLGSTEELKRIVNKFSVEAIIIAIPSLNFKALRKIYEAAKELKVDTIKIVPRIYDFHEPGINLKNLEDINIEDLIGRQPVYINYREIEGFLKNRIILVTGAGGSIGSEITLQVCAFNPQKVILFDIDETDLHNMELKLKKSFPFLFLEKEAKAHDSHRIFFVTGDIRDRERVNEVFRLFSPDIVFHAAAYKHVPMMEYNPQEAVKVNMFGTYTVAKASAAYGVKRFIMISTDKAVRPAGVMGATKRMAEYICRAFDNDSSQPSALSHQQRKTEFISVRFGNVLGSRGSVLPIFLEQLKHGGPLTVTHKDMQRYFMTIPEAVSLVIQASVIGHGGEVLILDMGTPVAIVTLAEELIRLHGLEPYKDIDIEFTGPRPGEKLFEAPLSAEEGTVVSRHEKIFIAKESGKYSIEDIEKILEEFSNLIRETPLYNGSVIKDALKKYVKHFDIAQDRAI